MREVFARREFQNWFAGRNSFTWLRDLFRRLRAWLDRLGQDHPGWYQLLLWGSAVLLVVLLVHIGSTIWRIHRGTARRPEAGTASGTRPVPGIAPGVRAAALAREGRYAEALAFRFGALLLDLEAARAVTLRRSKTPAEYADEARLDAEGRDALRALVARLYAHLFGALPCDAGAYVRFADDTSMVLAHVAPR